MNPITYKDLLTNQNWFRTILAKDVVVNDFLRYLVNVIWRFCWMLYTDLSIFRRSFVYHRLLIDHYNYLKLLWLFGT